MKYGNTFSVTPPSAFAEFFTETDFGGESGKVPRGAYKGSEGSDIRAKSMKLAPCTRAAFYENEDGSGKSVVCIEDARNIALGFKPALLEVVSYAEGLKGGKVVDTLPEGEYKPAELKKYDAVRVPRGVYLAFMGCEKDGNAVHLFENEEAPIDARLDAYGKAAVFALPGGDLRLGFKPRQELSDEDLEAVAGGGSFFNDPFGAARTFLYFIPVVGQALFLYDTIHE